MFLALAGVMMAAEPDDWHRKALLELYAKHVPEASSMVEADRQKLDRVARRIGEKLSSGGFTSVDAADVAMLALLETRSWPAPPAAQQPATQPAEPARGGVSDLQKGNEGIRQAQERLEGMPIGERMVITGDVASVLQGAPVNDEPDMTATSGRARVNFVLRAFSGRQDKGLSDGYFFVQMLSAGGAVDSSVVGGPRSFTALNDIATDRSRFNESTERGNIYLRKAFYEQRLTLGENELTGRAGIIDLTDYFDTSLFANNEARQFLNGAFVNSAAFKTGISAPGLMGAYTRKIDKDWLEAIVIRAGYAVSRIERAFASPVWNGEIEAQTLWKGHRGYWRMGGAFGNRAGVGSVRGFYLGVDHWVAPKIGVFGRYAISDSGVGSQSFGPVRQSYSGGLQVRRVDTGDRISAWSIAFSQAFGITTDMRLASERVIETYYRWQWTQHISITPDFQLILGSGGRRTKGTQPVLALRLNFGF